MKSWDEYIKEAKQKYHDGYLAFNVWVADRQYNTTLVRIVLIEIVYFDLSKKPSCAHNEHGTHWKCDKKGGKWIDLFNLIDTPLWLGKNVPAPEDSLVDLENTGAQKND